MYMYVMVLKCKARKHLLAPWCTLWCDAVLRMYSSGPMLDTSSVWIQNWGGTSFGLSA